jgi:glycosyltransferase involved in cell wall biosynthesis
VDLVPLARTRRADARHGVRSLLTGRPFLIERDARGAMDAAVDAAGAHDAVHADQLWMAAQGARAGPAGLRVLDEHNAVFRIPERLAKQERNPLRRVALAREARCLARFEAAQLNVFDRVLWVSSEDRDAVYGYADARARGRMEARSTVIPICVDVARYQVVHPVATPRRILFLGTMFWPPNSEGVLWFAREVLPRVRAVVPDALFTVVGRRPPDSVRALAEEMDGLMEVTGYLDDPTSLFPEVGAFVIPLLSGGGMRVKILEAWAHGLPVVSTTVGAEGIAVTPGGDALLADEAEAFAAAVVRLLHSPDARASLVAAGRGTVAARYDARTVYDALAEVYAPVL